MFILNMMFSSICLSFLTLSVALRRAAVGTQNLDQVAAVDLWRERRRLLETGGVEDLEADSSTADRAASVVAAQPGRGAVDAQEERVLAKFEANMTLAMENLARFARDTLRTEHAFDSAFKEDKQGSMRQAHTAALVENDVRKANINATLARTETTSKLLGSQAPVAHKDSVLNASASGHIAAEHEARGTFEASTKLQARSDDMGASMGEAPTPNAPLISRTWPSSLTEELKSHKAEAAHMANVMYIICILIPLAVLTLVAMHYMMEEETGPKLADCREDSDALRPQPEAPEDVRTGTTFEDVCDRLRPFSWQTFS